MEPNRELPPVENESTDSIVNAEEKPQNAKPEISGNLQTPSNNTPASPPQHVAGQRVDTSLQQSAPLASASSSINDSLIADDTDLIEKEWVNKAKQIVEQTKDDPHAQTAEMSKFKAEYQKKRYNKDVKVSNG